MAPRLDRWLAAVALGASLALCSIAGPASAWQRPCKDCDLPFTWDDDASQPPVIAPFPQGFALTVPVRAGQAASIGPALLDRYAEVAGAIGRCWSPSLAPDDAQWRDLTLRVSFRRDGTVNGIARIVHISDPADRETTARARASLLAALNRCTPLPLSPSLGRAIAGQIFAIRFVQQRNG